MNGDSTQWGLRDMLEHLFQQTPWLHATTYSLDKCDTHDDTFTLLRSYGISAKNSF